MFPTRIEGASTMPHPHASRTVACSALLVVLALAGSVLAQDRYDDPQGRFTVPIPTGWTVSATPDVLTLEHADPAALLHVLAPIGTERDVVAAALAILVDPTLDAAFAAAPLQATPVPIPSGTWTQRIYQVGDDIVAAISHERGGHTVLVLAQATQPAFMSTANAATNQVLLGLEVLISEPDAAAPEDLPYDVIEATIDAGDHSLAGILTLPPGDGPVPGIVIVSGSGAQDRDGVNPVMPGYAPLRWLADHLTRAGVAVLRFDERGIGGSGGDHESATSADLADDVTAALRHLAGTEGVDATRVGLLGHSEGSVIVGRVAAAVPDEVAFMIAMAGPALPYSEIVITQVERIAAASGASQAEIDEAVALQRTFVERAIAEDWEALEALAVQHVTDQLAALPEAQRAQLGDIDAVVAQQAEATVAAFQSPWLSYFMTYDPRDDLRRITAPTLVLFGELDVQVDVEQNLAPFEAALAEAGNGDVTVAVVPRANHLFQEAVTGSVDEYVDLDRAFLPGFLDLIGDWLTERFLP
jgi:pimeloyl-ACP methyl ester carboxylesterase